MSKTMILGCLLQLQCVDKPDMCLVGRHVRVCNQSRLCLAFCWFVFGLPPASMFKFLDSSWLAAALLLRLGKSVVECKVKIFADHESHFQSIASGAQQALEACDSHRSYYYVKR